jgi:benzoyl-CoA reductase subunit C
VQVQTVHDPETRLTDILERCFALLRQANPPTPEELPAGFRGTIGHFPVYFPEEIAYAAGLLPVNILGGGNRLEMRLADARMGSFVCSICRSSTELALNGTLSTLEGFVTHPICDAAKHLAGIWSRNLPDQMAQILYLPQNVNTSGAARYIRDEYWRLRADLEKRIGEPISDDALRAAIRVYNENRRLLRELYRIRRETPWKVSLVESYLLMRARTRMPCAAHTALLKDALDAIAERNCGSQDKPRVVFVGGFCEQPPLEMLETIEDSCFVVDDDLLIGLRWLTEDVAEVGDPLWALAVAYIEGSAASPVQHDATKSKEDYLMAMLKDSKADAAILTAAKFCEPGLDDQLAWSKHLDPLGIPYLVLEYEEKMTSFEQMAMQVETFAESLLFALA